MLRSRKKTGRGGGIALLGRTCDLVPHIVGLRGEAASLGGGGGVRGRKKKSNERTRKAGKRFSKIRRFSKVKKRIGKS